MLNYKGHDYTSLLTCFENIIRTASFPNILLHIICNVRLKTQSQIQHVKISWIKTILKFTNLKLNI